MNRPVIRLTRSRSTDPRTPRRRDGRLPLLVGALVAGAVLVTPVVTGHAETTSGARTGSSSAQASGDTPGRGDGVRLNAKPVTRTRSTPPVKHVFVINIENKGYAETYGPDSPAKYLSTTLRKKGVLLTDYYGTAHNSQSNYVAQISGQGPNPDMQADCQNYSDFVAAGTAADGQLRGTGCVFPKSVGSLPQQMAHAKLSWRGYMDDMDTACQHPTIGSQDQTQKAQVGHQYAARHNPFVYFHSIIDHPAYCKKHVVPLTALRHDLRTPTRTPKLSYIVPDLCNDGHDAPCVDGRPGGLKSADVFLKTWVPRILKSKAFKHNGMLIVTADESDGPQEDSTACCGETAVNTPMAGIAGAGGGKIGAVVVSKWTRPNTVSDTPYNHYALLASIENIYHLKHLGYAGAAGLDTFGLDIYNNGWNERRRHHHRHR